MISGKKARRVRGNKNPHRYFKGEVYKIVGFNHFDDKKYMMLMDNHGDMSKRV